MDQEICLVLGQVSLSFILLSEKPPEEDIYIWSGERLTKRQATSRPDHLWPKCQRTPSWGRSINGQLKSQSSMMQEDYEESISLTLRTGSPRKLRQQEENWKHQWLLPCLARLARTTNMGRPVARLMISSPNLRVSRKPVSPQGCVWKNLYRNIMRTILQEKVTIHYSITIWYTNLFLCLKQWRYPQQKQQWKKNGRNLKRFRCETWQKSETNQRCQVFLHVSASITQLEGR